MLDGVIAVKSIIDIPSPSSPSEHLHRFQEGQTWQQIGLRSWATCFPEVSIKQISSLICLQEWWLQRRYRARIHVCIVLPALKSSWLKIQMVSQTEILWMKQAWAESFGLLQRWEILPPLGLPVKIFVDLGFPSRYLRCFRPKRSDQARYQNCSGVQSFFYNPTSKTYA